jgi:signal transduction histidine kinase
MISFEMRLEIIRRLLERTPEVAARELEALQQFSRKLVSEMRTFVHRMRPLEGGEAYLMASTRRLVNGFQKESGVSVTFVGDENGDVQLPGKLGTEVLQVVREALHNVYKHAQATHVLFSVEQKSRTLQFSVQDNGQGYRFGGKYTLDELDLLRLGPRSIRQRVRALGGDLSIESTPGHGSSLRISVPLS